MLSNSSTDDVWNTLIRTRTMSVGKRCTCSRRWMPLKSNYFAFLTFSPSIVFKLKLRILSSSTFAASSVVAISSLITRIKNNGPPRSYSLMPSSSYSVRTCS
jgi:hypothetical protein